MLSETVDSQTCRDLSRLVGDKSKDMQIQSVMEKSGTYRDLSRDDKRQVGKKPNEIKACRLSRLVPYRGRWRRQAAPASSIKASICRLDETGGVEASPVIPACHTDVCRQRSFVGSLAEAMRANRSRRFLGWIVQALHVLEALR